MSEGPAVTVDAVVLRTSLGDNAVMPGAAGAGLFLQFFRVTTDNLHIDEFGSRVGQPAKHGFDPQYNRADDQIVGATYTPLALFSARP